MNKNITINVLPQSDAAWFFIFLTVCSIGYFWALTTMSMSKNQSNKDKPAIEAKAKIP